MHPENLESAVADELATILAVDPGSLAASSRFADLGLDSAGALRLATALAARLDRDVPVNLLWRHPSIGALAQNLLGAAPGEVTRGGVTGRSRRAAEPVAVVGIGVRLPGGIADPVQLWDKLVQGFDGITEVPTSRWDSQEWSGGPEAPGRSSTRWGGFLDGIDQFDPAPFRISPAEAEQMDPQQRLTLETAWAALEDSGVAPDSLVDSRTGVFMGAMFSEYAAATGSRAVDTTSHSAAGQSNSIIAARVAYSLGLRGPVIGMDTACSSSLTAVHLAVRSLQSGESSLALAGGVNVMLDPHTTVAMTAFGAMSPSGRCRTFGADADGYVRSEGCGVVVLRPLSDAVADGDRIYAVIRGSAINGDGASNGLTAPSPAAQADLLREAWAEAAVSPTDVDYIEAHGTGTLLGDPIEAGALGEVFGTDRDSSAPDLRIGSIKSNLGHLEPAAGVVGLIKASLALHHGALPAGLHAETSNPHIDFPRLRLRLVDELEPWPHDNRRYAGVSSFGFGGSNAHVALSEAPVRPSSLARLRPTPGAVGEVRAPHRPPHKVVLAFSGHGSQWSGMGHELLALPVVHDTLAQVERHCAVPLRRLLADQSEVVATREVQPLLFGLQVAIARVLQERGLVVDAVLGQSVGEAAAAVISGALTLDEGARLISRWSSVVGDALDGTGSVRVLALSVGQTRDLIADHALDLDVSAELTDERTCVSGTTAELTKLDDILTEGAARTVAIPYPSHGRHAAAVVSHLTDELSDLVGHSTSTTFVSTVTGGVINGPDLDADYWARNTTEPSLLRQAVSGLPGLLETAELAVVEIGPGRVLTGPIRKTLRDEGADPVMVTTGLIGASALDCLGDALEALADHGLLASAHPTSPDLPSILTVSGATPASLRLNAARLADAIDVPSHRLASLGRSLATRRAQLDHRAAVVTSDPEEAVRLLRDVADGVGGDAIAGSPVAGDLAVLFTGQGSQRVGMALDLMRRVPDFATHFRRASHAVDEHLETPLLDVLSGATGQGGKPLLDETQYTQPALFVLETALFRWWSGIGMRRPQALIGHSIGELAAAHVAGMMDLADAARLVCARGAFMAACRSDGAMVSIEATEAEVLEALDNHDGVSLAGVNAPQQTVISGDADAVRDLAESFSRQGRRTRQLTVSHAFHSHHMDDALEQLRAVAEGCTYRPAEIPVISTRTGVALSDPDGLAEHWVRQVREPVRFLSAVEACASSTTQFLEVGPAPVLSAMTGQCLPEDPPGGLVSSLRPDLDESTALHEAAARLHVTGHDLDWARLTPDLGTEPVATPGYAFDRRRYWAVGSGVPAREAVRLDTFWDAIEEGDHGSIAQALSIPPADHEALEAVLPYLGAFRRDLRAPRQDRTTYYESDWERTEFTLGSLDGTWVVVGARGAERDRIEAALVRAGASVSAHSATDALQLGLIADPDVSGCVVLALNDPAGSPQVSDDSHLREAVRLAQAAAAAPQGPVVWIVTRQAVAVDDTSTAPDPASAAMWGLSQVAAAETDGRWRGSLDIDTELDDPTANHLVAALAHDGEEHIALRGGTAYVQRLRSTTADARSWSTTGTALLTGSGAVAQHLAVWLAARGVQDLVVVSRSGKALTAPDGLRVHPRACDVADPVSVRRLIDELGNEGLTPRSVFHTAGVLHDQLLPDLDFDTLSAVLAPKVEGAMALDDATRHLDLDAFVLSTSVIGVLGNHGQAAYAMANRAADAFAHLRRSQGRGTISVAFGPWDGPGMASGPVGEGLRRRGLNPMAARVALDGLGDALAAGRSRIVSDIVWPTAAREYVVREHRGLLRGIPAAQSATHDTAAGPEAFLAGLDGLAADSVHERIQDAIRAEVAGILRCPATDVDVDRGFSDLGVDSMMAVAISQRVTRLTGVPTTRTIAFDRPSVRQLSDWLTIELTSSLVPETSTKTVVPQRPSSLDADPIVVVGAGLRMPGGAHDLESLWSVLDSGTDTVREVPADRLNPTGRATDADPVDRHLASLIDDIEQFDPGFFGITPREAIVMDPQQRMLLESAWNALESSGILPEALRETRTGVFIGCVGSEYAAGGGTTSPDMYSLTGRLASFTAGRIAYHLGTQGPAYAVDTACSSSLVALHVAAESLRNGECEVALAGGVQVIADADMFTALSRAEALSSDGRSRTFSADADGYGRGEGAGVLVLMRQSDAERGGHPILGVILGSAIMHDGASSGITAPNGTSQERVITSALQRCEIEPASVDYVECHGTGTPLGDPIEVNALAAAYPRKGAAPLLLGTAKSVIGHLEAAAGIAGVCKVLASFRAQAIPANFHSTPRNPNIIWDDLDVQVVDHPTPWLRDPARPRRAGVSAFGLSGTNAHLILEEPPIAGPSAGSTEPSALNPSEFLPTGVDES